jgi:hypothetical protein
MARVVSALVLILAASSGVFAQKQLALLATITDPAGGDVATIDPMDVKVVENGQNATVLKVDAVQRVPKLQVLIDNGIGMPSESIGDLRKGLQGFLDALPPTLEVTLVTTAPNPRILEKATTDHFKLVQAIGRIVPDSGTGHFVDSLAEATDRIEKDKQEDASYTLFAIGTTTGDLSVRDSDVKTFVQRVQARHTTVHAVVLTKASANGGIQLDLGQSVARATGGRFESINVPNRLVTLVPEIGAQIAKSSGPGAKQFRITFERPAGASGDPGGLALGVNGKVVTSVSLDQVRR